MKQVTFALRHHQLTNTRTWTADSRWLVFDVRPSGASFTGETIERVNVDTGEVEILYRTGQGAYVGVVTVHPSEDKYVFIHGPENPDERWHYDFHHRRGVVTYQGKRATLMRWISLRPIPPARCAAAAMCMFLARTASSSALPITTTCCMNAIRRWICATLAWRFPMAR